PRSPALKLVPPAEPESAKTARRATIERVMPLSRVFDVTGVNARPAVLTAMALGVVAVVLLLRMLAVQTYVPMRPADPVLAEAGTRWIMVLTSERIDDFRRTYHRTPAGLGEVGFPPPEMIGYERLSDKRYRLTASCPSGPLVLDSMRPREDFLGRS